jgi:hypothetical protein
MERRIQAQKRAFIELRKMVGSTEYACMSQLKTTDSRR